MDKQALQKIIGGNLYRIRTGQKLTREQLAEKIGVSVTFCANLESGKKMMSVVTLRKVADVLSVPVDSLLYADRSSNAAERIQACLQNKPEEKVQFAEKLIRLCMEEMPTPNDIDKEGTEHDAGAE